MTVVRDGSGSYVERHAPFGVPRRRSSRRSWAAATLAIAKSAIAVFFIGSLLTICASYTFALARRKRMEQNRAHELMDVRACCVANTCAYQRRASSAHPDNGTRHAPRVHAELTKLGFIVSEMTVSRYMSGLRPDEPQASRGRGRLGDEPPRSLELRSYRVRGEVLASRWGERGHRERSRSNVMTMAAEVGGNSADSRPFGHIHGVGSPGFASSRLQGLEALLESSDERITGVTPATPAARLFNSYGSVRRS